MSARYQVSGAWSAGLPTLRPTPLPRVNQRPGWTTFLRHPFACLVPAGVARSTRRLRRGVGLHPLSTAGVGMGRVTAGTGISTRCPSTTPVGLALGPDLPWAD